MEELPHDADRCDYLHIGLGYMKDGTQVVIYLDEDGYSWYNIEGFIAPDDEWMVYDLPF